MHQSTGEVGTGGSLWLIFQPLEEGNLALNGACMCRVLWDAIYMCI